MGLTPIQTHERIPSLDVIRGFALLGIFLVNMPAFQWPELISDLYLLPVELNQVDQWIRLFFDLFIQAKFYTIFSFLFGAGFYIFMKRAETKGYNEYALFSKRLAVLGMFGFLHLSRLWYGDILLVYAAAGFFLMLFYKRKARTLVIWMFALFFLTCAGLSLNFAVPYEDWEEAVLEAGKEGEVKLEEAIHVYQTAGYGEWLSYRWEHEVIPVLSNLPFSIPTVLLMFLAGVYAMKKGIFQDFSAHRTFVKRVMMVSLLASLPFSAGIIALHFEWWDYGVLADAANHSLLTLSGLFLSLFYIGAILFLLEKERWQRIFRPFSYAGRMALTNYILQTLIGVGVYTGSGWYGEVDLLAGTLICLLVFPLQIVFSYFWLKKFHFGPLEWIWRKLTYSGVWRKESHAANL